MATAWFYADANHQQVGPVTEEELRAAASNGVVDAGTLAWRDGLPQWTALGELAGELGIEFGAAPPLPPPPPPPPLSMSRNDTADVASHRAHEVTPPPAAGETRYAGFWLRVVARIIDHFVIFIPVYVLVIGVSAAMGLLERMKTGETSATPFVVAVYVAPMVANFFYFSLMHSSPWQATIGKKALGLKVTDLDGGRLTFGRAALRWFCVAISYATFCIGFMMAGLTERKRALHDMLASTLVVRG